MYDVKKTKKHGGIFNVCRIPLSKMNGAGQRHGSSAKPSNNTLIMIEELLVIFEKTVSATKKMKADFNKILKKKFVENAEQYAFLDPFAAEFRSCRDLSSCPHVCAAADAGHDALVLGQIPGHLKRVFVIDFDDIVDQRRV